MPRLELTAAARSDLRAIATFTELEFGRRQRDAYIRYFETRFQRLVERPEVGIERGELGEGLRASPARSHVIYYTASPDMLLIIRILHHAQDAAAALDPKL